MELTDLVEFTTWTISLGMQVDRLGALLVCSDGFFLPSTRLSHRLKN
jgi:hypothetical protein